MTTDEEKIEALVQTLRLVRQCFKSADQSSTCLEDHHPSCLHLVETLLKEYDTNDD